jgi:subtilisin family serine protease
MSTLVTEFFERRNPFLSQPVTDTPEFNSFAGNGHLFEVCERRLVLAAQLLIDLLPEPSAITPHGELHGQPSLELQTETPLELHLRDAHAASGWNQVQQQFGLTGAGQTVAVIDSGIAWDHVALGQGYGPGYRVVGGWDFTEENDAQPYDDGPAGFHGTHVAGIIGSSDAHHTGVAPDADLVALRVFNDMGQGQLSWVEKALEWVHDNQNSFENPITTVNLSLGTSWNSDIIPNWATLEEEFQQLANDGIIVIASAGNSFTQYNAPGLSYPAASPYVLPVASVGDDGELSDFSQRHDRALAAPGERILSTVPDYVLGRDGIVNDFSTASGTSMAAPYVAGASVLVRQAMEMVGFEPINLSTISQHLRATADSIYDSVTGVFYDRLNLQSAIDTLIPDDVVGDHSATAAALNLSQAQLNGWLNSLGDRDVYQFTAATSGTLRLEMESEWLDTLNVSVQSNGQQIASGGLESTTVHIVAGQTYELNVFASQGIGDFQIDMEFVSDSSGAGNTVNNPSSIYLGAVDYAEQAVAAGSSYRVQASHDGTFTVQWNNSDAPLGAMQLTANGQTLTDTTWSAGELRLDTPVRAGDWLEITVPGQTQDRGELVLANVLSHTGTRVTIDGSMASDAIVLNLQNGVIVEFGAVDYVFSSGEVNDVRIDGYGNNDTLTVVGSALSDKVDLTPTGSSIINANVTVAISSVENVNYSGGGGPDRVYLYDSDTDDTLTAYPRHAKLVGVGYGFEVADVDRIFMHATGGGQDYAYLYDSSGNDQLSVRPQFTSLSGNGFFNYVRGFERVYAYANAGGVDQADIYDSAANDRFMTNGASASIVGPGFSSYTKSFETVHAHANSGGIDLAALYGSSSQTNWQTGSDFVSFREQDWSREARGFESVETFVAGQTQSMSVSSMSAVTPSHLIALPANSASSVPAISSDPFGAPLHPHFAVWASQDLRESGLQESCDDWTLGSPTEPAAGAEAEILREVVSLREWLTSLADLPEEELLNDPSLESQVLDRIFEQHEEIF